ncbi:hypothetical protein [Cupriavidus sp. CuC1]|uniref:hypothetical protein n=1 Tax=Cupriavidus sp. CuC1 TaxID=3373131 RepID=UPI0037D6ED54
MGIPQTLLNKYKLGLNLPGFMNALILANEACVSEDEALRMLAREEAMRKGLFDQAKQAFSPTANAHDRRHQWKLDAGLVGAAEDASDNVNPIVVESSG